ncbi:MAG TPA: polysaccharide biosynthesis tyrosine autokinase [Bryobacteraceae bacterium]|nr:polysaccharide biosynthesis tyrosine autokinase [Bryobacteraceae bacterium]
MKEQLETTNNKLMLRARSEEFPPLRIEVVGSGSPRRLVQPRGSLESTSYWRMLRRHVRLLLALVIAGGLAGYVVAKLQTPLYQAHILIAVDGTDIESKAQMIADDTFLDQTMQRVKQAKDPTVSQNVIVRSNPSTSHILEVDYNATTPRFAADYLNAVAADLMERDRVDRLKASEQALAPLSSEVRNLKDASDRAAAEFEKYARIQQKETAAAQAHYTILDREVESAHAAYAAALQKLRDSQIAAATTPSHIRVVQDARPPARPFSPRPLRNIAIGLLSGLILGLLVALVLERTNQKFHEPGEISACLNLQELGAIPTSDLAKRSHGFLGNDATVEPEVRATVVSKAFESVLASVWASGQGGRRPRVLVVTSPASGEGKSMVAINLAVAFANTNRRILLIDGDLRSPELHRHFGLENNHGLGDILDDMAPVEDYSFEELVAPTVIPNLYVLTAGTITDSVASLRNPERLADLLSRFRLEFHEVLIDTPPALTYSDARILGRVSDGVILVVRASKTNRDQVASAQVRLEEDGTQILGAILNRCDRTHS